MSSLIASSMGSLRTISFLGGIKLVILRNLHGAFEKNKTLPDQDAQILIDYAKAPLEETCLVVTADKVDGKNLAGMLLDRFPAGLDFFFMLVRHGSVYLR
ncbi:MAG TPA: hypothetical protein EYQ03_08015 [Nitrospinaceae bacterium]|nr:hypothetical protein [Nitrospinaceae bacterium]